jgi:hypothetical protein
MVSETQAEQPHCITAVNTTTPRLEQEFRYDIQWQTHNSGVAADNYGVSKGLEIIPAKNVEVILALPPYIVITRIRRLAVPREMSNRRRKRGARELYPDGLLPTR